MHEHVDQRADQGTVAAGMAVYDLHGAPLGAVEAVGSDRSFRVMTHTIPPAAIDHIDAAGIHLRVARAAFAAGSPETRADAG